MQEKNSVWISYRDAYKAMIWFEKYSGPKQLIQSHLLIYLKNNQFIFERNSLILKGQSLHTSLVIDDTGRVTLPLLKQAYDENAELILYSTRLPQNARVNFKNDITVRLRSDGQYQTSDLLNACDQALKYYNYINPTHNKNRRCTGVRFMYLKKEGGEQVKITANRNNGQDILLNEENQLLAGNNQTISSYAYYFDLSGIHKITTPTRPIAIIPIIE